MGREDMLWPPTPDYPGVLNPVYLVSLESEPYMEKHLSVSIFPSTGTNFQTTTKLLKAPKTLRFFKSRLKPHLLLVIKNSWNVLTAVYFNVLFVSDDVFCTFCCFVAVCILTPIHPEHLDLPCCWKYAVQIILHFYTYICYSRNPYL